MEVGAKSLKKEKEGKSLGSEKRNHLPLFVDNITGFTKTPIYIWN